MSCIIKQHWKYIRVDLAIRKEGKKEGRKEGITTYHFHVVVFTELCMLHWMWQKTVIVCVLCVCVCVCVCVSFTLHQTLAVLYVKRVPVYLSCDCYCVCCSVSSAT